MVGTQKKRFCQTKLVFGRNSKERSVHTEKRVLPNKIGVWKEPFKVLLVRSIQLSTHLCGLKDNPNSGEKSPNLNEFRTTTA